ncbi:hypothetical protein [Microbacterium sp.]|uniref:hypothetical protein n=1 Tax=Microbacterium sp. TaxID=51671 RepID=UPI003F96F778
MALKQNHTTFELEDGRTLGPVRVIFADKIQYERSAKANNWSMRDEVHLQMFLTWHAAKREGVITLTFEEFSEQLIDIKFDAQVEVGEETDPT